MCNITGFFPINFLVSLMSYYLSLIKLPYLLQFLSVFLLFLVCFLSIDELVVIGFLKTIFLESGTVLFKFGLLRYFLWGPFLVRKIVLPYKVSQKHAECPFGCLSLSGRMYNPTGFCPKNILVSLMCYKAHKITLLQLFVTFSLLLLLFYCLFQSHMLSVPVYDLINLPC